MILAGRRGRTAVQDLADINTAVHGQFAAMLAATDRDTQRRHFEQMRRLIERRPKSVVEAMERDRGIIPSCSSSHE
jgi:aspartate/methionine/tyrosine aminotransferase